MRVFERKPHRDEHLSFTIGSLDAQLTEDVIRTYSLGPALKRLGRALARQHFRMRTRDSDQEVIGVNLKSVGFSLLLAKRNPSAPKASSTRSSGTSKALSTKRKRKRR
jgi:hypothetical protein